MSALTFFSIADETNASPALPAAAAAANDTADMDALAHPVASFNGKTCTIRQAGRFTLVLGAWGHLFGAWMVDPNAQWNSHEILPALSPVDLGAGPLRLIDGPSASLLPDLGKLVYCADGRMALDRWLRRIPAPLLEMAGQFGRNAWMVLDMIAQNGKLAEVITRDLARSNGHRTACLLALLPPERRSRAGRADLVRSLTRFSLPQVLAGLIGDDSVDAAQGSALLSALSRLSPATRLHPRDYRLLSRLVASPARRRLLDMAGCVDTRLIKLLGWAPEDRLSLDLLTAWRNGAPLSQLAAHLAPAVAPVVEHRQPVYT